MSGRHSAHRSPVEHPAWCVPDLCTVSGLSSQTVREHRGTALIITVDRVRAEVWLRQQPGQPVAVGVLLAWHNAGIIGDLPPHAAAQLGAALAKLAVQARPER